MIDDDELQDLRARIVADQDQLSAAVLSDSDTVEALATAQEACRDCMSLLVDIGVTAEKALALVVGSVVEWCARSGLAG